MTATLTIGNVKLDPPVMLAPMAAVTDAAFRALCARFGCDLGFTELTNAPAIARGSSRSWRLLERNTGERHLAAHIYGSDPERMGRAAARIAAAARFDLIDINCGCPVRRIVTKGYGAALMADPERIAAIVRSVKAAGGGLPVTVKTRLGLTPDRCNISEVAHAVEDAGGAAVIIHARFASQHHGGSPQWEHLARVAEERRIPVVGNGGVESPDDAVRMLHETGVQGVMIGRAAWGRPWLFREIRAALRGEPVPPAPTDAALRALIEEHLQAVIALREKEAREPTERRPRRSPDEAAVFAFRPHLLKYTAGRPGAGTIRRGLNEMRSRRDVLRALDRLRNSCR